MRHALLLVLLALAACERRAVPPTTAKPEAVAYPARGVVQRAKLVSDSLVIAHEEIPGYMAAMTMEFHAATSSEIAHLQPGDVVDFRLKVTETRTWIEEIRKRGSVPPPVVITEEPPAETLPALGTVLPDVALRDENARALHLSDFQGGPLAITFIFTRCPMPEFCPRLISRFAEVQALLKTGEDQGCRLLSVTIDPAYDTPERLAEYAARAGAEAAVWRFATGEAGEIERLAHAAGLQIARGGVLPQHTLRTLVIDRQGRVRRILSGNRWDAAELTVELRAALD